MFEAIIKSPSPSGEGLGWGTNSDLRVSPPPPAPHRVKSAPRSSGHAGGMADPVRLKGRGF